MVLIPILLYHSVRDTSRPDRWTVGRRAFAEHVDAIAASGRVPLRIGELAAALRGEAPLPEAPMAVTFDDGFADTAEAVEELLAHGIGSTVFVGAGTVGAPLMLSPSGVRELAALPGVEVGAHGVRHLRLDELPPRLVAEEVQVSRDVVADLTGRPVRSFAYPHGAYDRHVRDAVARAGYTAAAAVRNALSSDADDPLAIARWTVTRDVPAERIADVLAGRGVPVAGPRERWRTRGWRTVRRARRRLAPAGPAPVPATADPAPPHDGTVAVVVCTASPERSAQLVRCVEAIRAGARPPEELVVVVDRDAALHRALRAALPGDVQVLLSERAGLSEARNAGIAATRSAVVAFVDDDAVPERDWLARLTEPLLGDGRVLGTGGDVIPDWEQGPRWLPEELLWAVGCCYRGHPVARGPIRNPIGCSMAFRRTVLERLGGFAPSFGKRGRAPVVCEETELCLRLEREFGPGRVVYVPEARVHHRVPAARVSWRLLVVRSLSEGLSKGRLRRLYPESAVRNEQRYLAVLVGHALPALVARGLRRRDRTALLGGVAILVSLAWSAVGFAIGISSPAGEQPAPR